MIWVEAPPADTDWERLAAIAPEAFESLADLVSAAWADNDPILLELSRLRVAALLGNAAELERRSERARDAGLGEDKVTALAAWPTSPLYTAADRACLGFTEQFVIDANGITDQDVATMTEHLGPAGTYAFAAAVSALETFQRACLTLGISTMPEVHP